MLEEYLANRGQTPPPLVEAATNLPSSAWNAIKDFASSLAKPSLEEQASMAKGYGTMIQGGYDWLTGQDSPERQAAGEVVQGMWEPWSTPEKATQTIAKDPVGSLVGIIMPEGKAGKMAEALEDVGKAGKKLGKIGAPEASKIRAYHGSPHDFDEFSLGRIGTGEGAQAYGHGLYFAENEGVARIYRDNISASQDPMANMNMAIERLNDQYMKKRLTPEMLAEQLETNPNYRSIAFLKNDPDAMRDFHIIVQGHNPDGTVTEEAIRAMRRLESNPNIPQKSKGKMYEVNIDADPAHFLDWDKPLSEQPEHIRRGIGWTPEAEAEYQKAMGVDNNNLLAALEGDADYTLGKIPIPQGLPSLGDTGEEAYRKLAGGRENVSAASQRLREAGIPGIKYLDQGSRLPRSITDLEARITSANEELAQWSKLPHDRMQPQMMQSLNDEITDLNGQLVTAKATPQTRNFVVFDDKLISIVKKYGIAGALAAGAINQMQADQLTEQGYQ